MVKTACERLLVSFMLVAATVLEWKQHLRLHPHPHPHHSASLPSHPSGKAASPRFIPTVHEVGNVCIGSHSQLRQVLNVGAQDGVLPDPQRAPTLGVQEVSYAFAVDLHVAHLSGRSQQDVSEPMVTLPGTLASTLPGKVQLRYSRCWG